MKKVGYVCLNDHEELFLLQRQALKQRGCKIVYKDLVFSDKEHDSGFMLMLNSIQQGDVVIVYDLNSMTNTLSHFIYFCFSILDKGCYLESVIDSFDSRHSTTKDVFDFLNSFEQHRLKKQTQKARVGAKKRGVLGGRPEKMSDRQVTEMKRLYYDDVPIKAICDQLKVSRPTIYKYLKR